MAEKLVFTNIDIDPPSDRIDADVGLARGANVAVDPPTVDRNEIIINTTGDVT